jgi:7,8-dihydroneopterin aldolase/epimerase/oxygenase
MGHHHSPRAIIAAGALPGHCRRKPAEAWWGMTPHPVADAPARYVVTIRGLVLMASIGIRRRERGERQRVRISVDLTATPAAAYPGEDRRQIINYEKIVAAIREIAASGHIDLCEGFAERICAASFADPRVERVRVWVEKLDVFPESDGVGAILERSRPG